MRLPKLLLILTLSIFIAFSISAHAQKTEYGADILSQTDLDILGLSDSESFRHGSILLSVGRGNYLIADTFDVDFRMVAIQTPRGFVRGAFRQSLIFQDQLIDFEGKVTCMAVDAENGRAWIGAVVTKNNSEHPSFTTEIHQPGRDVWFRVLDTGRHSKEPDRSTFMGFEGGGGIITSEEYCAIQIWPNDPPNARTNPVTSGNILVRPNDL